MTDQCRVEFEKLILSNGECPQAIERIEGGYKLMQTELKWSVWRIGWMRAIEYAAIEAESWRGQRLLLATGEMTAREKRTVRAVVGGIAAAIRGMKE
jgi:hypothetical protein